MLKKLFAFCLAAALILSVAACNSDENTGGNPEYTLWSAPSTVKVMREAVDYAEKRPAKLTFDGVKGEYENYQLMITASSDIRSYSLATADLSGTAGTFPKENFTVYHEYYHYVTRTSTSNSKPGYYPDALIPADLSIKAGENTVGKDCNQGIWVTAEIPADAKPGFYSGTFVLDVDGTKTDIPVSLTVRDYTLPTESTQRSLFAFREQRMMEGELDSGIELKREYYEFFLDYRLNLNMLPTATNDADELVAVAKQYCNDDRVNTYSFAANCTGGEWRNLPLWREWLYAFAENSSPEHDLFKKLIWYYVDEPEGMYGIEAGNAWALNELSTVKGMILDVYDDIAADTTGRYAELKKIDGWENYFLDPPTLVTVSPDSKEPLLDETSIWCPGWGYMGSESQRQHWERERARASANGTLHEFWWYGCSGPLSPYPTYHMDDDLISSRVVSWLQQQYDVTGVLYWSVHTEQNVYETPYFSGNPGYVDVNTLPPGEGYLVYPGVKYDHFGPLPSMRLMSIRDGSEEYELLIDLEEAYEGLKSEYGVDIDVQNVVHQLYERLADGTIATRDLDLFDSVRTSLLNNIEELSQPHGFLMDTIDVKDNIATVSFYVRSGYTVTFDGNTLSGGPHYTVNVDLTKTTSLSFTATAPDGTEYSITRFLSKPYTQLIGFDGETLPEGIRVTETSEYSLTEQYAVKGNALDLTLRSVDTENAAQKVRAYFGTAAFENPVDFTQVETVTMTVYNATDQAFRLSVWLNASGREKMYTDGDIQPGYNTITINLANDEWDQLANMKEIILDVPNDSENMTVYRIVVDDIKYTLRGAA